MVSPLRDPEIVAMVRHHHERLDGSGYPSGLAGDDIPLGARIIAVADTFDAITSVRPYRRPRKQQAALQILKDEAGERLDAEAVAVFLTYYAGRRTAAWSSLALALPERMIAFLTGGAGPIAQGVAATVATVGITAAMAGPVIHPEPPAPRVASANHLLAAEVDAKASAAAVRAAAGPVHTAPHRHRAATLQTSRSVGEGSPAVSHTTPTPTADPGATEAAKSPVSALRIGGAGWVPENSTESAPDPASGRAGSGDSGSGDPGSGNSGNGQGNSGSGNPDKGKPEKDKEKPEKDKSDKDKPDKDKSESGNSDSGNSGSGNSGSGNSGSGNSGSGNSGSGNSGSGNSGSGNSGSGNSGSGNSGSGNSGSGKSGSGKSGSGKSGSGKSGSSGGGLTDLIDTVLNPVLSPILGHH